MILCDPEAIIFHSKNMINADNKCGYFVLSFDTELAWGYYDAFDPKLFSADGNRERRAIELLVELLDEFHISATFGVVGQLFRLRFDDDDLLIRNRNLKYPAFEKLYKEKNPLLHGNDILDFLIARGSRHEIAFHGYTHKIFAENEMSKNEAKMEIEEWLKVARLKNIEPKTVIFPRNKIGYLDLFKEYGFICYRGEEPQPKISSIPLLGHIFRRFYYFSTAFLTPPVYDSAVNSSGLVNLPSSRWLFGFNRKMDNMHNLCNLQKLRIRRILKGIKKAADEKKIIHLWAHPHEFRTKKDIEKLRYILKYLSKEIGTGRIQSICMADLARKVLPEMDIP